MQIRILEETYHRSLNTEIFCKKYGEYYMTVYRNLSKIEVNLSLNKPKKSKTLSDKEFEFYRSIVELHIDDVLYTSIKVDSPLIAFIQETLKQRGQS